MKNTTRILALLLALVLTLGLSATAFADEVHAGNNGTITIENAIKDQTYTIYEILYLESKGHTTEIHTANGNVYECKDKIGIGCSFNLVFLGFVYRSTRGGTQIYRR